jgi:tetratricopeptide (TPR) repeat protein
MTDASHLSIDALAEFAEGRVRAATSPSIAEHLALCRSCMAAYAEAVRYRAAWLAAPDAFASPAEVVAAGLLARRGASSLKPGAPDKPRSWRLSRWLPVAAGLIVLLGGAAIGIDRLAHPGVDSIVPAGIRAGLERASARGLVLPGGEPGANRDPSRFRSSDAGLDPRLAGETSRLIEAYEGGNRSTETLFALAAGLHLGGHVDAARDYVEEGLGRTPDDTRLLTLSADIAYRTDDLPLAESRLRRVLELRPRDSAAELDLALVLLARGLDSEARTRLEHVSNSRDRRWRERAESELRRLRGGAR